MGFIDRFTICFGRRNRLLIAFINNPSRVVNSFETAPLIALSGMLIGVLFQNRIGKHGCIEQLGGIDLQRVGNVVKYLH